MIVILFDKQVQNALGNIVFQLLYYHNNALPRLKVLSFLTEKKPKTHCTLVIIFQLIIKRVIYTNHTMM